MEKDNREITSNRHKNKTTEEKHLYMWKQDNREKKYKNKTREKTNLEGIQLRKNKYIHIYIFIWKTRQQRKKIIYIYGKQKEK